MTSAVLLGEPLPIELMNTVNADRHGTHDALGDDGEVAAWLAAVADRIEDESGARSGSGSAPGSGSGAGSDSGSRLGPGRLDGENGRPDAAALRELRDALRRLAAEATGDPRPPATAPDLTRHEAIATLNALARTWPEIIWPDDGEPSRAYRADGAAGLAVGLIAHQGVELFTGPAREHLRPCLAPNCLLFFAKDHARRHWCSPACGNRARVARHYQRRR